MKKALKFFSAFICVTLLLSTCAFAYGNRVNMYWGESSAEINNISFPLSTSALRYNKTTYVPVDDILNACGYNLGWDSSLNAVTAHKGNILSYVIVNSNVLWKGSQKYEALAPTIIHNDIFYMPVDMFNVLTDDTLTVSERITENRYGKRDLLLDTKVSDTNRVYGDIFRYNNVSIVGNFGMMTEYPTSNMVEDYTEAVNLIGNTAPVGVEIYNILIPTSAEFYGPAGVYIDQTDFIKSVYSGLSERIMPINAVKVLDAHANESIYFKTDHHWTQRGAYYAYKELMQVKGEEVPYLADFDVTYGSFVGSLATFTQGTYGESVLKSNPDTIEKFIPLHYTNGAAYSDMYMKNPISHLEAVYPNVNSYLAFIGGDTPMAVFTSDVNNGKKLLILKESFGNAFATWALNNYSEIYVVDVRNFNNGGEIFNLNDFYGFVKYDDVVIINSISSLGISKNLKSLVY